MTKKIKTHYDHIIIGQGLAGSCVALQLIKRGKKILVFDEPLKNKASAVAAGLFNPIAGKFMTKAWLADKIFPSLFQFYEEAEQQLSEKFFYPQSVYRPFISVKEQNQWMGRSENPELKFFIDKVFTSPTFERQIRNPFGGVLINHTGYVDTNSFMMATRNFLKKQSAFQEAHVGLGCVEIFPDKVLYQGVQAKNIICCEGVDSLENPLFGWVPIIPLKGEMLTVSLPEKPMAIFNRGIYIVPKSETEYWVGATYKPGDERQEITVEARLELKEMVNDLLKIRYTINHQYWGIRPATPDIRPVLGAHPRHKNVIIFNGLGTKGVSLSPYFSGLLANWLEGKAEIPLEVNIERFKALYSKLSSG